MATTMTSRKRHSSHKPLHAAAVAPEGADSDDDAGLEEEAGPADKDAFAGQEKECPQDKDNASCVVEDEGNQAPPPSGVTVLTTSAPASVANLQVCSLCV